MESPTGINAGGWGLYLKTEDLAKLGQLLQGGVWEGRQILPAEWVREMSSKQVDCVPAGNNTDKLPEKDAVIVTTVNARDMRIEINKMWDHLLRAL